jgi:hypothetical protein
LSPFANLFIKHVGNVYERYKVSERACEVLMEKFVELKGSTARQLEVFNQNYKSG